MSTTPRIIFLLAVEAFVASCTRAPKLSDEEFIQWVQVDGLCHEDHATQDGRYSGELVHWRNKVTGVSKRYGSVHNLDSMRPEAMAAEIHQPNRYRPPFSIEFGDITASVFQSPTFVLHGVSDDLKSGAGYEATCNLTVKRRLDHLPSNEERKS